MLVVCRNIVRFGSRCKLLRRAVLTNGVLALTLLLSDENPNEETRKRDRTKTGVGDRQ